MTGWVVCTQEVTNVEDQVRTLEQRAYAKAEMAASVTTGARPHVEGVRMYTHDFSLELTKLLKMGASMEVDTPAGAATGARKCIGPAQRGPRNSVSRAITHQQIFCLHTAFCTQLIATDGGEKTAVNQGEFDLSSSGREVVTKELAETILKPLLATGASFVK
eukprot:7756953-Pyramimonas_sp.AAC.1